jgi:hypothetical protein
VAASSRCRTVSALSRADGNGLFFLESEDIQIPPKLFFPKQGICNNSLFSASKSIQLREKKRSLRLM